MSQTRKPWQAGDIRPIANWVFVAIALLIVASTCVALVLLMRTAQTAPADQQWSATMEAIRNSFLVGGGTAGLAALLLTVRRQRSSEISLIHTNVDVTQRRNNEIFSKAVEQLANESKAVRRGGVISLERLAQDNETFRQSVIDVLCAYLRTPFRPPLNVLPHLEGDDDPRELIEAAPLDDESDDSGMEEYELRQTIQDMLERHLRANEFGNPANEKIDDRRLPETFWHDIDVNLDRAVLVQFSLDGCRMSRASFVGTRFLATTMIRSSIFGTANFGGARFARDIWFDGCMFINTTKFTQTEFCHHASFEGVRFQESVTFMHALFSSTADFNEVSFRSPAYFGRASFEDDVSFEHMKILDESRTSFGPWNQWFREAVFNGDVKFSDLDSEEVDFTDCRVQADKLSPIPPGWTVVEDDNDDANEESPRFRMIRSSQSRETDDPE